MILIVSIILLFNFIYFKIKISFLQSQIDFLTNSQNTDDFWKEVDRY